MTFDKDAVLSRHTNGIVQSLGGRRINSCAPRALVPEGAMMLRVCSDKSSIMVASNRARSSRRSSEVQEAAPADISKNDHALRRRLFESLRSLCSPRLNLMAKD